MIAYAIFPVEMAEHQVFPSETSSYIVDFQETVEEEATLPRQARPVLRKDLSVQTFAPAPSGPCKVRTCIPDAKPQVRTPFFEHYLYLICRVRL